MRDTMNQLDKKRPYIDKLRHQETIKKGPKIFTPLKGKGSYRRNKEKFRYRPIFSSLRDTAYILKVAGLLEHAKEELQRAGLFDKDSDYNGEIAKCVMNLCKMFSEQGHSGFSADLTLDIFDKLSRFKTLTPITKDSSEWNDVSSFNGDPLWQNKRDPSCFSKDGGKTWYSV